MSEPGPLNWHNIASNLPSRTNKDCRKRWHYTLGSSAAQGFWTPDEDQRLFDAVRKYGTKWAQVAAHVGTRNGGQCSKRWHDNVNPEIDRSEWTAEEVSLKAWPAFLILSHC